MSPPTVSDGQLPLLQQLCEHTDVTLGSSPDHDHQFFLRKWNFREVKPLLKPQLTEGAGWNDANLQSDGAACAGGSNARLRQWVFNGN